MFSKKWVIVLLILFVLIYLPCQAADVTLRWDANTEEDLAGYKLYYKTDTPGAPYNGTGAIEGDSEVNIPLTTTGFNPDSPEFTLTELDDAYIYFLVITAYDTSDNESGYSNEVCTFYISSPQNGFIINPTNYTAFNVSGRGAAGKPVNVYSGDTLVGTAIADTDGSWSIDIDFDGISEGEINLSATTYTTTTITSNIVTGTLDITAPYDNSDNNGCFISTADTDKDLFIKAASLFLAITVILSGITMIFIFLIQVIKRSFKKC